jgi:hypothetical protein
MTWIDYHKDCKIKKYRCIVFPTWLQISISKLHSTLEWDTEFYDDVTDLVIETIEDYYNNIIKEIA